MIVIIKRICYIVDTGRFGMKSGLTLSTNTAGFSQFGRLLARFVSCVVMINRLIELLTEAHDQRQSDWMLILCFAAFRSSCCVHLTESLWPRHHILNLWATVLSASRLSIVLPPLCHWLLCTQLNNEKLPQSYHSWNFFWMAQKCVIGRSPSILQMHVLYEATSKPGQCRADWKTTFMLIAATLKFFNLETIQSIELRLHIILV